MGQIVGSLKQERKVEGTTPQDDDVTQSPLSLFPYMTSANSPSNSDEPSMSSSIIETTLVQEESHLLNQNVAGKFLIYTCCMGMWFI